MEHIEEAASIQATARASCRRSCVGASSQTIREHTRRIARALKVVGLMGKCALKGDVMRARGESAGLACPSVEGRRRVAG
jgi:hypothetical protein